MSTIHKVCNMCHISKPLSDYNKNVATAYNVSNRCRSCSKKVRDTKPAGKMIDRICANCGKSFKALASLVASGRRPMECCSIKCANEHKVGKYVNEKNANWLGNHVGYHALHSWVARKLGTPNKCEICGTTRARKYEWSNISGEYKRDLIDWQRVCRRCHIDYDNISQSIKESRHKRYATIEAYMQHNKDNHETTEN